MSEYKQLLLSEEWKAKRNLIIKRDKHTCTSCNNSKLYSQTAFGYISGVVPTDRTFNICVKVLDNRAVLGNDGDYLPLIISKSIFRKIPDFSAVLIQKHLDNRNEISYSLSALKEPAIDYLQLICDIDLVAEEKGTSSTEYKYLLSSFKDIAYQRWNIVFGLHVHHNYYQHNKLPWDYPDDAFTTLCWQCHKELHENGSVPVLDELGREIEKFTNCQRCHGAGWFPEFNHVESGTCFRCHGARYEELLGA